MWTELGLWQWEIVNPCPTLFPNSITLPVSIYRSLEIKYIGVDFPVGSVLAVCHLEMPIVSSYDRKDEYPLLWKWLNFLNSVQIEKQQCFHLIVLQCGIPKSTKFYFLKMYSFNLVGTYWTDNKFWSQNNANNALLVVLKGWTKGQKKEAINTRNFVNVDLGNIPITEDNAVQQFYRSKT